jgi:hypothetical protein
MAVPPPGGLQTRIVCYLFLQTQGCLNDVAMACRRTYRARPYPESSLLVLLLLLLLLFLLFLLLLL